MDLRELGLFLRGNLNIGAARLLNLLRRRGPSSPLSIDEVAVKQDPSLLELARLLEGKSDPAREEAVVAYLEARRLPYTRHPYRTFQASGSNLSVELGSGERLLVLIAHHDAVPGCPGANDNASSVAVLLSLASELHSSPRRDLRVRLLFTGSEERCYLGARLYVPEADLLGLVGVVSLELCGIGDSVALWDVLPETERSSFLETFLGALESIGLRREAGYHLVGRIPVFGSDHRAFVGMGVPAVGMSILPSSEEARLRAFIFTPWKAVLHRLGAPRPFDTYHRASDRWETLEPGAMELARRALLALVRAL